MTGYTDETFAAWYERLTDLEQYDYDTAHAAPYGDSTTTHEQGTPTMTYYNAMKIHRSNCDDNYAIISELRNRGQAAYSPSADLILTSATVRLVQSLTTHTVTETTLDVKNISFDEPNAEVNCDKAYETLESKGFYVRAINETALETDCPWYILHRMYAVTQWVEDEEQD